MFLSLFAGCCGNPDAKRLYDDLLSNYNKLVRPVVNVSDALTVKIKLKLSQLIDVVSTEFNKRNVSFDFWPNWFVYFIVYELSTIRIPLAYVKLE